MQKYSIQEIRATRPGKVIADEIILDSSAQFLNKDVIEEALVVKSTGIDGDNLQPYNGPYKEEIALYAYSAQHYSFWQEYLETEAVPLGIIGENMLVRYMDEYSVCIGDIYEVGGAILQVSQPHLAHWGVSVRMKRDDFAKQMQETGRIGWYFRVLQAGQVQSEDEFILIERPHPEWTIAAAHELLHFNFEKLSRIYELATCSELGLYWRDILQGHLRGKWILERDRLIVP